MYGILFILIFRHFMNYCCLLSGPLLLLVLLFYFSKHDLATPFFLTCSVLQVTVCPLFQRACHLQRCHVHPGPVLRPARPPADVQGRAGRRPGQERAPGPPRRVPRHGAGVPRVRAAPGHRSHLVRTLELSGRPRLCGTVPRMSVAGL